jgi:hypothetical protein
MNEQEERFIKLTESIRRRHHLDTAKDIEISFNLETKHFMCKSDGLSRCGNIIDGYGDAILLGLLIEDISGETLYYCPRTNPEERVWTNKKESNSRRLKDDLPLLKSIINDQQL